MTQSLYHYTNDFLEVKAQLDAMYDPEDEVYKDTLEYYEDNIATKAENIIKYCEELLGLAELQKAEAKRLNEAAKAKENKANRLMEYLDNSMKAMGVKNLQAGLYKLTYHKGREVVEVDEDILPDDYWVEQPKKPMSKPELKKLIESGVEVKGVCIKKNPDSLQVKR